MKIIKKMIAWIVNWSRENPFFYVMLLVAIITISYHSYKDKPQVLRCIDGDTFAINRTVYRLAYIDTPEEGEEGYEEASEFTCLYLKVGNLEMKEIGKDIYKRKLVEVNNGLSNISLNEDLILINLAVPFYGRTTDRILIMYNSLH